MNEDWVRILTTVRELLEQADDRGGSLWFRGQHRASWPLKSRLHRHVEEFASSVDAIPPEDLTQLLRDEYKSRYRQFKAEAWPILEPHQRGEWSLVFGM